MKTLVTGGAGFIGTFLMRALVDRAEELDSLSDQQAVDGVDVATSELAARGLLLW